MFLYKTYFNTLRFMNVFVFFLVMSNNTTSNNNYELAVLLADRNNHIRFMGWMLMLAWILTITWMTRGFWFSRFLRQKKPTTIVITTTLPYV